VNYVDAGYAVALTSLFVYALGLVFRRRRWERALETSRRAEGVDAADATVAPGGRP
jgi:hypothetical protein